MVHRLTTLNGKRHRKNNDVMMHNMITTCLLSFNDKEVRGLLEVFGSPDCFTSCRQMRVYNVSSTKRGTTKKVIMVRIT